MSISTKPAARRSPGRSLSNSAFMKGSLFRLLWPSMINRSKAVGSSQKSRCTARPPGRKTRQLSANISRLAVSGISCSSIVDVTRSTEPSAHPVWRASACLKTILSRPSRAASLAATRKHGAARSTPVMWLSGDAVQNGRVDLPKPHPMSRMSGAPVVNRSSPSAESVKRSCKSR